MQQLVVYVVVFAIVTLTSSEKDSGVFEPPEISSFIDVVNMSFSEPDLVQTTEYHNNMLNMLHSDEFETVPVDSIKVQDFEKVKYCISFIAKNGLQQSLPTCEPFIRDAIKYCERQLHQRSGGRVDKELVPCTQMLAVIKTESGVCSLSPGIKHPRCNVLLRQKRKRECEAGELFGQIPGSVLPPQCFTPPHQISSTQQMPLRLFTNRNTISSATTNANVGDLLVKVYTIPIGQGDCNIISCNGGKNVILFDCGSTGGNNFTKNNKEYNLIHSPFSNAESVAILISHGHADHHNMIRKVLNPYVITIPSKSKVTAILGGKEADYQSDLRTWLKKIAGRVEFLASAKRENFCSNSRIWFDLLPGNLKSGNANERGMLMKLHCQTCKSLLLFTGDMEGPTAKTMAGNPFLKATHYKIAHHGAAALANGKEWLKAIMPVEVHISHRYGGRYHHPRCAATNRLMDNCKVGIASGTAFAKPHELTCFGEKAVKYKAYDESVFHRIFSTAPRKDKICLIVVYFAVSQEATTEFYCDNPRAFSSTPTIF